MSGEQIVQVDPAKVLAEDNARFGLRRARVESLKSSILELGGVQSPVGVEPLSPAVNGFTHKLMYGFYRHQAVVELNKEQNAGLTLPAIVRKPADATERLRHQLAENMERENQSPMDQAVAIKKLMDSGVPRLEIRRIFARPGGKKGTTVQPASNAWINIVLRFLELPKTIQGMIHEGIIGVEAAYELGKVPPDKRQAVVDRAKAERERQLEIEEKDEEKYLNAEKKLTEAVQQQTEALSKVDTAKVEIETAEKTVEEKRGVLKEIQKTPYLTLDDAGKAALKEKLKAAETDLKAAEKLAKDAKNGLAKLHDLSKKAEETAKAQREKLEAARKALPKKKDNKKPVTKADIQEAAKVEGVSTGVQPLNITEIRQYVKDVSRVKEFPKVAAVGKALADAFGGVTTTKQLIIALAQITGESK